MQRFLCIQEWNQQKPEASLSLAEKMQEGEDFRPDNESEYLPSSGYNLLNFLLLNVTQ